MKLSIIVGSLYFIYTKTILTNPVNFKEFILHIKTVIFKNKWTILILLLFSFFNWFFEILKWKTLVFTIKNISFLEAAEQSLTSLTMSLFTPYRIKEYNVKAAYYSKNKRQVMLLNLIGKLYQLLATVIFGVVGLVYFISHYEVEINPYRIRRLGFLVAFIILMGLGNKRLKLFGFFPWMKIREFVKKISYNTHLNVFIYSCIRFLIISHQFYFLLLVFGVHQNYFTLLYLIFTMYLIAYFIPSISLFDWAIKGSVSILIFTYIDILEITIISIVLLMWILNFALPSLIGSYYLWNFKLSKS